MQEKLKQIASRIRELRDILQIAPQEMAKTLGIELGEYERFESGTVDIPVGILYQIAQRCDVELSSLLTGEEPRLHAYCLTRAGKGVSVNRRHAYGYQALAANFRDKQAEPFLVTVEPHAHAADGHSALNSHPGQEFDYVLEGTLQITLGTHELVLEAGDSLFFDSGVPHGMKALNNQNAKFLALIL